MSRARRKTPIFGVTTATSDHPWKKAASRKVRRQVKLALTATLDGDLFVGKHWELVNPWSSETDGQHWWAKAGPKNMRK